MASNSSTTNQESGRADPPPPLTSIPPSFAKPPSQFNDSPNARSKSITTATGSDTHGTLNQHLPGNVAYQVGVHDDKGQRRTMEDAYSFVVDFARVRGQGYFAVFDGHAGKHAAEWCGRHFHEVLLAELRAHRTSPVPDVLNHTFHAVDSALSAQAQADDRMHSGCTAVAAFLRLEDASGGQSFLDGVNLGFGDEEEAGSLINRAMTESPKPSEGGNSAPPFTSNTDGYPTPEPSSGGSSRSGSPTTDRKNSKAGSGSKLLNKGTQIVSAIKSLGTANNNSNNDASPSSASTVETPATESNPAPHHNVHAYTVPAGTPLRRVLYTANAGDARAVLCRAGRAVRLTYDHKGSDKQEAKRIMDAGGFVMSGRVNGVLAVTRSLGDSSMKDFVVGSPYTTETELADDDEFLIIACDGLWDVASDQEAVDIVRRYPDAQEASRALVEHALKELSTDNITSIVVRFLPGGQHTHATTSHVRNPTASAIEVGPAGLVGATSQTSQAVPGALQPPPPQQLQYQQMS